MNDEQDKYITRTDEVVDELYKQIEKVIYDEVYIYGHEALLYPEGERRIKQLLTQRQGD